ncbi:MAG: hypothetical protein RB191_08975 [Terriglobia bacterium]|nr:hypothetical protein [Terriglobia bacterium]
MAEAKKLAEILDAVAKAIRNDWAKLEKRGVTREEQASIRSSIDACAWELANLRARINNLPFVGSGEAA